jgi:hypothetical protein
MFLDSILLEKITSSISITRAIAAPNKIFINVSNCALKDMSLTSITVPVRIAHDMKKNIATEMIM